MGCNVCCVYRLKSISYCHERPIILIQCVPHHRIQSLKASLFPTNFRLPLAIDLRQYAVRLPPLLPHRARGVSTQHLWCCRRHWCLAQGSSLLASKVADLYQLQNITTASKSSSCYTLQYRNPCQPRWQCRIFDARKTSRAAPLLPTS